MVTKITKVVNKATFKRSLIFFLFAATITIIATSMVYLINPDISEIMEGIEGSSPDHIKESKGIDKVWSYFIHNGFAVPFQMFILALIPIQFLYLLNIISTSSLLGILFGIALQVDFKKGVELIVSSLPHSTFEIFAYCLLAAVLFELNQVIRVKFKNIFKKEKEEISLINKIIETVKIHTILSLPLIILAGFLETYIADIIFGLFQ